MGRTCRHEVGVVSVCVCVLTVIYSTSERPVLYTVLAPVCLCVADDRPVRESERKAALMHFDTDQVSGNAALCMIVMAYCMFHWLTSPSTSAGV